LFKVIDVGTPGKLISSASDSSRDRTFSRGYPNLMRSYGELLELRGSKLALLNLRLRYDMIR